MLKHSVANFASLVLLPVRTARTVSDLFIIINLVVIYIWQQQENNSIANHRLIPCLSTQLLPDIYNPFTKGMAN